MRSRGVVAVLTGFVAGTCLAGLPHVENEPCLRGPGMTEGVSYRGGVALWPLATRCEFTSSDQTWVVKHGPGIAEGLAWAALGCLLFLAAVLTRSALARGAAVAASVLALVALGWHFGGEGAAAGMLALTFGVALAFAVDRALRPPGRRAAVASAAVAAAVTPSALAAWVVGDFAGFPYLGAAGGLLAGALACAAASAPFRPSAAAAAVAR